MIDTAVVKYHEVETPPPVYEVLKNGAVIRHEICAVCGLDLTLAREVAPYDAMRCRHHGFKLTLKK